MTRWLLLLIATAACGGTRFQALNAPPPGRTAELDDEHSDIRLSRGVALAFECLDTESYGPCAGATATVADPSVAAVYPVYLDALAPAWQQGPQPRSAFVVVGLAPGTTRASVTSGAGDRDFDVLVAEE